MKIEPGSTMEMAAHSGLLEGAARKALQKGNKDRAAKLAGAAFILIESAQMIEAGEMDSTTFVIDELPGMSEIGETFFANLC